MPWFLPAVLHVLSINEPRRAQNLTKSGGVVMNLRPFAGL